MNDQSDTNQPQSDRVLPQPGSLRASDAERERTASRLRHAGGEGRLRPDELEQRLTATFSATTRVELDRLVCDLPMSDEPDPGRRLPGLIPLRLTSVIAAAAALVVVMLIAGAAGLGFGQSGAAASNQPSGPGAAHIQANPGAATAPASP
jgi:hypothetical protein